MSKNTSAFLAALCVSGKPGQAQACGAIITPIIQSPLQYQKPIRLQEARLRLTAKADDVAGIGFSVGYDDPSQLVANMLVYLGRLLGDAARLRIGAVFLNRALFHALKGLACENIVFSRPSMRALPRFVDDCRRTRVRNDGRAAAGTRGSNGSPHARAASRYASQIEKPGDIDALVAELRIAARAAAGTSVRLRSECN